MIIKKLNESFSVIIPENDFDLSTVQQMHDFLKAEKAEFPNKIFEKIEIRNNPGLEAKRKDLALFKITAYAIVAFCVTLIAVAISPTWLGFALGLGLSVPGVWLTGKLLDKGVKKII